VKLSPGQVISGTLRLVRRIAEGGMGSVWLAEHLVLGRHVAVKFMSRQWAAVPQARTRFLREARITARIESPHVVSVLDCRLDEADEPYLVLELLAGENLDQHVHRKGPVSIYVLEEIVDQLCGALGATHRSGFIHRDLKPENVFLVEGPKTFVKLLDYGVAKPTHPSNCLDVDRLPAGTPQYMSPEHMFEPETTDERSDLFALAAVAYFAITGRSPFAASSIEELYFAIEDAKFERPSAVRPELPHALDAWFEKALARDRKHRFQTAHEMRDAFHEAVRTSLLPPPLEEPAQLAAAAEMEEEDTGIDLSPMTKSVPGLPKRRLGRSVAAVAATAVAACLIVWKADTEVRPASASVVDENAIGDAEAPSGGNQLQAAAATPAPATTAWHVAKKPPRPVKPRQPAPAPEPAPDPEPEAPPADSAIQQLIGEVPHPDVAP